MTVRGRRRTASCVAIILAAGAGAATAQVLEISDAGAVVVHDRPEVTSAAGVKVIAVPTLRRPLRPRGLAASPAQLARAADGAELSPDLVEAVAWRESHLRHGVVSAKGAVGEMQLMPMTARALGVDPADAAQNLSGGARYLRTLLRRYDGDTVRALAAYNAGPGAVDHWGGVPPFRETRAFVAGILDDMSARVLARAPRAQDR